jgi:hypothetical protein
VTVKLSVNTVAFLVSAFSVLATNAPAPSNSKGPNRPVVVGTLKSVDSSGTRFDVQQSDEYLRKLYVNSESKVYFVGLPAKGEQKPRAGLGVKATCEKMGASKRSASRLRSNKRVSMLVNCVSQDSDLSCASSVSCIFTMHIFSCSAQTISSPVIVPVLLPKVSTSSPSRCSIETKRLGRG